MSQNFWRTLRRIAVVAVIFTAQTIWAGDNTPSLLSITYYELYGTPVQPLGYAQTTSDALGFDLLAEYNPSYYISLGLNFENTTFYDVSNTTLSFLGLETRFFGAPNGKSPFAPYVYGGAALGLSGAGTQLKAGLGSRIQLISPVYLDFSAGSNWVYGVNNISSDMQYLNFRGGLSLSTDWTNPPSTPTENPTATITATPANTVSVGLPVQTPTITPTDTATLIVTATATNTPTITSTPTMTMTPGITVTPVLINSKFKTYYRAATIAFEAQHYSTSAANFKQAIAIKSKKIPSYYYAESNAMLGVIYQFHLTKAPGHNKLAVKYYKRALKIDPSTKLAKKYLKMLLAPKKAKKATKKVKKPSVAATEQPAVEKPTAATQEQSVDIDMSKPAADKPAASDNQTSAPADQSAAQPAPTAGSANP